ncbi:MAG: hypothetical protein ACR2NN_03560 [Bryobacteraceae bacterium]
MVKRIVWTEQAKADVRAIEQQTALQILRTLARYAKTGQGNALYLQGVEPPLLRLHAKTTASSSATGASTWISRVLDRKQAYR